MLLWEVLNSNVARSSLTTNGTVPAVARAGRSPYDRRCAAVTRCGRRCRGKIRTGTEFCVFHDPQIAAKRRVAVRAGSRRRRLTHLPDGYLRKLTSRTAVGEAMNRLYREIRLQFITPEMGRVLFDILTRLLDSGLCERGLAMVRAGIGRGRADKLRPKLHEVLTRSERAKWGRAVENAAVLQVAALVASQPLPEAPPRSSLKLSDPCEDSTGLLAIGTA